MLHSSLAAFVYLLQLNRDDSFLKSIVYTARALNNHITHCITAVFIMKTTREVFIIMRAGKIDKRDHEIAKKNHNFVNL